MNKLLIVLALLLTGCTVDTFTMEACKKTCDPGQVFEVTATKCSCQKMETK